MPFNFVEIKDINGDSLTLSGAEHKHVTKVMRHKKGDRLSLTDGAGLVYDCIITRAGNKDSSFEIITTRRNVGEPQRKVTMAIGMSTASKFDQILQMCVEVGVSAFAPVLTAKSKVRLEEADKIQRKLNRWREVIKSALKQSERSRLPEIAPPQSLENFLTNSRLTNSQRDSRTEIGKLIAEPSAGNAETTQGLQIMSDPSQPLIILVGPESGFTPEEITLASENGFTPFKVGQSVLRAETAAVSLASLALLTH